MAKIAGCIGWAVATVMRAAVALEAGDEVLAGDVGAGRVS